MEISEKSVFVHAPVDRTRAVVALLFPILALAALSLIHI